MSVPLAGARAAHVLAAGGEQHSCLALLQQSSLFLVLRDGVRKSAEEDDTLAGLERDAVAELTTILPDRESLPGRRQARRLSGPTAVRHRRVRYRAQPT